MNKRLAIKGHPKEGNKVIEILKMLGGKDVGYSGTGSQYYYYIDEYDNIAGTTELPESKTFVTYTLEEFLEKFPYKVGDKVKYARINDFIGRITNVRWDDNENQIIYVVEWDDITKSTLTYFAIGLQPYKEETTEEIKIDIPKGYEFAGVDDDKQHVVFTKIQPQYPKTYKECCEVLGLNTMANDAQGYRADLIICFQELLIARNAYWEIAGEEMGLGKPWKPDFKDDSDKYFICYLKDEIWKSNIRDCNRFLVFPTEKIRDEFYENFKDSIKICKNLI